jgi:hypothetical protein
MLYRTILAGFRYNGSTTSIKSSLIILGGSLRANQTYEFKLIMTNHQNIQLQAIAYLTVRIERISYQLVSIGYVIVGKQRLVTN